MIRIWNFLDGKKTYIGGAFLFASCFIEQVVGGIWSIDSHWVQPLTKTLEWIGMAVMAGGAIHKSVKSTSK